MKIRSFVTAAALVGATFVATRAVYSEEKAEDPMKAMAELAALAPEHEKLAEQAGTWDGDVTYFHEGQAIPSKGTMTSRTALGGRVLVGEWKGEAMGAPFEGLALSGYDKTKKQHWSTWCSTMDTAYMPLKGGAIKDGVLTTVGEPTECCMTKQMLTTKEVVRFHDKDHHTMEMFMIDAAGTETKAMEIRFTRRGAEPLAAPAPTAPETPAPPK